MPLRSGELATRAAVNPQTLRFYEREHLLPAPPRQSSGYRLYPESAVTRVRFIKRAQELGFSLAEIRDLLNLRVDPERDRADVRAIAAARLAEIDSRIHSLQTMRAALVHLATQCSGHGPAAECPILQGIDAAGDLLTPHRA